MVMSVGGHGIGHGHASRLLLGILNLSLVRKVFGAYTPNGDSPLSRQMKIELRLDRGCLNRAGHWYV